jgi:Uma2 family endonuclease/antitoxin (DNA-binding transcriptional repressor) of toxin-antitoxin stability system
MYANATDLKNNFGYYLSVLKQEDVIVLRNGKPVARLSSHIRWPEELPLGEAPGAYGAQDDASAATDVFDGRSMPYSRFIRMYEKTDKRYEFIDGKVWLMSSPTEVHQRIVGNLYFLLRHYLRGKTCRAYVSPLDVHLGSRSSDHNVVQPDLLVVCDLSLFNDQGRYIGAPSVTVEVLSAHSRSHDLVRKMGLYLRSGVEEYWTVDAAGGLICIYRFRNGQIVSQSSFDSDSEVRSDYLEGLVFPASSVFD